MRTVLFVLATAALLALSAGGARADTWRLGPPMFGCPSYAVNPPGYYGYGYGYGYAEPPIYFNTWGDPDYRALRYNRYFSRYQEPPRIFGFTLH